MVAAQLNIPFYVIDAKKEFKKEVVDYFLNEYKNLRTPNPCIVCNETIKFDLLLKKALSIGCEKLATGHYVRLDQNSNSKIKIEYNLLKGIDETKDQSYMLYRLNQDKLSKVLFPLGEMLKKDVRDLAIKYNLPVKEKPESQEICFFSDKDYRLFLRRHLPIKYFTSGEIVDVDRNVIGRHDGLLNYTIGQRKGIDQNSKVKNQNYNSKSKSDKNPLYVTGFDAKKNQLTVGSDDSVYKSEMTVSHLNYINPEIIDQQFDSKSLSVKIRYHHLDVLCNVKNNGNEIKVKFKKPQRAITPGQSAVFYLGEEVIGGGVIQ
jgi:tRNA-specific 2-thiouridylase